MLRALQMLLIVCLLSAVLGRSRAEDQEAVTFEAADLSEAHAPDLEDEMKSMESLLHWAIGEPCHACMATWGHGVLQYYWDDPQQAAI